MVEDPDFGGGHHSGLYAHNHEGDPGGGILISLSNVEDPGREQ